MRYIVETTSPAGGVYYSIVEATSKEAALEKKAAQDLSYSITGIAHADTNGGGHPMRDVVEVMTPHYEVGGLR